MDKILISACLCGDKTRYDGKSNLHPKIDALLEKYELIPFCSEVEGGLSIPRDPAERIGEKVISSTGRNVTKNYERGAELAYNICLALKIKIVILKDRSPACGVYKIHDGSFSGKVIDGMGVTAELLTKKGIKVLSENDIDSLL